MKTKIEQLNKVLDEADCLVSEDQLNGILDKMAANITKDLNDKLPLVVCVMNGALIPGSALLQRLHFPLEIDFIHATRYGMETQGDALKWLCYPQSELEEREILVIDDIFDQGHTLKSIIDWFKNHGAAKVYSATIINKLHDRKVKMRPDYVGIDVDDRFLFGYGMDYKGFFRNLPGIYAVKGS